MNSMCAPRVTRQMSRRYSNSRQTLSSMCCVTFPIAVLMRSRNSGSGFGSGGTSQEDHDVQIAVGTRVEPPQNCYSVQIPGHTNYARSGRQPFPSNTGFMLSPPDGSSDYRTIPNVTFIVCNRHEFHDLTTLSTRVMA
jgi:hypothetical protein